MFLLVAAIGCSPQQKPPRGHLLLGHSACLSGQHAKAGEQAKAGVTACIRWINDVHGGVQVNGRKMPLEYLVYDCESKRESVLSLVERLITVDDVNALVAPYSSSLTLAGAPIAERYEMLYLDHGGASDVIFDQSFRYCVQTIGPASRYHVSTLDMLHAAAPGDKRVALVYEDSEFARSVQVGAAAHAKKLGYEIVFDQVYPVGASDLTPLLAAMKRERPDIFLGGGHFHDGQLLCRQMSDLDVNVKAVSLIAAATLPAFYDALKQHAEGVMGPSQWEEGVTYSPRNAEAENLPWFGPTQEEFLKLFRETVGREVPPDYHAAEAGAAVLAWVLAVENAGTAASDSVRNELGKLDFYSFYGRWKINERGLQVGHAMVDLQWQNGQRKIVWPADARTANLVYPKPSSHAD